jgi:hypothetical protein
MYSLDFMMRFFQRTEFLLSNSHFLAYHEQYRRMQKVSATLHPFSIHLSKP